MHRMTDGMIFILYTIDSEPFATNSGVGGFGDFHVSKYKRSTDYGLSTSSNGLP